MAFSTIDKSSSFMNPKIYTGTGASNAQTGLGFQPDFTWIKNRDAYDFHVLTDAVRGVTKYLKSDETTAETTNAESLKSFDSDGFTVGTQNEVNTNTEKFASWNWKAGTTTGLSGGTITPTSYSINTTSGFGIYKYTGTGSIGTISHGLGIVPKMIIIKKTSATASWQVGHNGMGWANGMYLDITDASTSDTAAFNSVTPTSSLFTIGTSSFVNTSAQTYIAYVFADVAGYSKMGSYVGNGSTDGTFVYTGFRPDFLLIKETSTAASWFIIDSKRSPYNVASIKTCPDLPNDDTNASWVNTDFVSNGFKFRTSEVDINYSGSSYIYMAFGQPIVSNSGVCANAR